MADINDPNTPGIPPWAGKGYDLSVFSNKPILNALNDIRLLNDRIRANTQDMATYLNQHSDELKKTTEQALNEKTQQTQQSRIRPNVTPENIPQTKMEELRLKANKEIQSILASDYADQVESLTKLGRKDNKGRILIGKQALEPQDFQQVSEVIGGKSSYENLAPHLKTAAQQFKGELSKAVEESFGDEWSRAAGFQNMREKGIASMLLGRAAGVLHPSHMISHSMGVPSGLAGIRPNQAAAQGQVNAWEGVQDITSRRTMGHRLSDLLESRSERNPAGLSARVGSLLGKGRLPVIGEAMIAYQLLQEFGNRIPLIGNVEQMATSYRRNLQTGQLTGQGFRAGLQATQIEPYHLMQGGLLRRAPVIGGLFGLFDPITKQIAENIVQSVREQGFTGAFADQMYQSMASVYRKLGIDPQLSAQLITSAIRTGGESLQNVTEQMMSFHDATRQLNMNINEYTQSIITLSDTFRSSGATDAIGVSQALLAGAPRIMRSGQGLQAYSQFLQASSTFATGYTGVNPLVALTGNNVPSTAQAAEVEAVREFNAVAGQARNRQEQAQIASQVMPLFKSAGMDESQVLALMNRIQRGRGPGAQARAYTDIQAYQQELHKVAGTKVVGPRHEGLFTAIGRAGIEMLHHGLSGHHPINWHRVGKDLQGLGYPGAHSTVQMDLSKVSDDQLRDMREQLIQRDKHFFTGAQKAKLEAGILDRHSGRFEGLISQYMNGQGPRKNAFNTPWGQIVIEMKGKAKKAFDAHLTQNDNAVNYGQLPANQAYPYSNVRVPPFSTPGD